jgi:diguanylate cyclase (GGDEF)-like protein/PAS domain S-box-containing protein
MNVKEAYQREINNLRARAINLEAELEILPVEVHGIEHDTWIKIKSYFGNIPGADASKLPTTSNDVIPRTGAVTTQGGSKLQEGDELFQAIAEKVGDLVSVLDTDGRRIYNNPSYRKLFGVEELAVGSDCFSEIHPDDRDRIKAIFRKTVETGVGEQSKFRFVLKDGSIRYIESEGNVVHDSTGKVSKVIVISHDVTERKKIEEQLRHVSYHDVLTGLPNRILLSDRLKQAIAAAKRNNQEILSLMFIDLDQFKQVNDTLGHTVGDLLLKEVAIRIQDCLRDSDTAARIGGDEFVVLLPSIKKKLDTMVVAEKIRHSLCQPIVLADQSLRISSSIGVAFYPENGSEEEMLLKSADSAMYDAKKSGRNMVRFFTQKKTGENWEQMN